MLSAVRMGMSARLGAKQVHSIDLANCLHRIDRRAHRSRRENANCIAVGLALDAAACALVFGLVWVLGAGQKQAMRLQDAETLATAIGSVICLVMLAVAFATKPEGRAEIASRLMDDGFRATTRQGADPATSLATLIIMMIALYGSFAIVESARRIYARCRLTGVDRCEMARILAEVSAAPMGVPVQTLLKHHQALDSLRRPVAALLLDGWVILRDDGRVIEQCPPHNLQHGWKHPLAEVFVFAPTC